MPNWVNVKLSAHTDVINAITNDTFGKIDGDFGTRDVDFELIMPIPPDLKDYWTGSTVSLQEQAKDIVKNKWEYGNGQHQIPMTEKDKERFRELYGASDWYDWCVKNWGCKWNAQTDYCNSVLLFLMFLNVLYVLYQNILMLNQYFYNCLLLSYQIIDYLNK